MSRRLPFCADEVRRGLPVAAVCLAVATASLLIPSAPTTDPWGWIVWGREAKPLIPIHCALRSAQNADPNIPFPSFL